jgi:hypothetical protein
MADLHQALDVEGQQEEVQDEHRIDPVKKRIRNEGDVARDGAVPQGNHRLHVEGREHHD